jgi:membrane protein
VGYTGFQTLPRATFLRWLAGNAVTHSAALAFYTLVSLAPVLVVAVTIAGAVFGEEATRRELVGQVELLAGREPALAVEQVLAETASTRFEGSTGWLGVAILLVSASAVFAQLQSALNSVWEVAPQPHRLRAFLRKRLLSFGLVLTVGFVLLVSLVVSAAVSALGAYVRRRLGVEIELLSAVDFLVFVVLITFLFALMFRFLPDARVTWRDVAVGAAVTSLLFSIGKELIGAYLGRSGLASLYGVAGSMVLLLVWTYYSTMVLLLGAAFTRVWSGRYDSVEVIPEVRAERLPRPRRLRTRR